MVFQNIKADYVTDLKHKRSSHVKEKLSLQYQTILAKPKSNTAFVQFNINH